jgi:hypothetical protein
VRLSYPLEQAKHHQASQRSRDLNLIFLQSTTSDFVVQEFEKNRFKIHVDLLIESLERCDEVKKNRDYLLSSYSSAFSALATQVDCFLNFIVEDEQQKARLDARAARKEIEKMMRKNKSI